MSAIRKYKNFYLLKCYSFQQNGNVTVIFYKNKHINAQIKDSEFLGDRGESLDSFIIDQSICNNVRIVFDAQGIPGIVLLDHSNSDSITILRKYDNNSKGFYIVTSHIKHFYSAPKNFTLRL